MTKILELPEEVARQLENEAQERKLTPEKWALIKLQQVANGKASGTLEDDAIEDGAWNKVSRGVIDDNRELLERLAR